MKRILKSPLFWVLVVEIVILMVLGLLGFRITYNPNLITDWDAVSATAGWVSAIATICIPIVAVVFQNKLEQNKNEIGEANKATLAELKKFKDKYSEILEGLSNGNEITQDRNESFLDVSDENLLDYIRASIRITAYDAAMYFGISKGQAVAKLDSLVEQKLVMRRDVDGIGLYFLRK